jgi:DNA repair exonuclease SbcCD ATPase subunit
MSNINIEQKISELKLEYVRIQGDIERLESLGHSFEKLETRLLEIENEIKDFRKLK